MFDLRKLEAILKLKVRIQRRNLNTNSVTKIRISISDLKLEFKALTTQFAEGRTVNKAN